MKKVVVAMDSMKGCLDSLSASKALAAGIKEAFDSVETVCVPVADGGEGTSEALAYGNGNFRKITSRVIGPIGRNIDAEWHIDENAGVAFIDMASAAGLALIPEENRNPLYTTTYGVGQLIIEAVDKGAKKVLLGLGGSATVDAGLGACQAMGLLIKDKAGEVMPVPFVGKMLPDVGGVEISGFLGSRSSFELSLLCDVNAPFTGHDGAARVFGPQKGASKNDVDLLESGMENVRKLIADNTGIDLKDRAGSGAAGGTAGGLLAFGGGLIESGAPLLLDAIGFDEIIKDADLIITGEGSSDRQTLMGKIPYEILRHGKKRNIPVWLVAGRIADEEALHDAGFGRIICVNSPEIVDRSNTVGEDPMDPKIAIDRLCAIFKADSLT
ncbi:MAG: glycerate kinase [Muribaculaceae bacterium]|nr:glycerate kinase [Muribaculaceae bacterium]